MDEKARAILASLGITGENVVQLPTGEFQGGGFVGPLMSAHLYRVNIEGEEQPIAGVVSTESMGTWGFAYYFDNRDIANAAAKERGLYNASAVHRIEMVTRNMICTEEMRAKLLGQGESRGFGEVISGEVQVRTVTSKKYRHEWQLIGFPSLVSAVARVLDYDVEPFDVSELRNQDTVYTDELFAKLFGSPDAKKGDEDYYTESTYWKQRAALWASLGESNAMVCHTKAMGTKYSTESELLDACFTAALSSFSEPIYGRFRLVADPRVDAVFGDENKRNSLGIITDLYGSEAQAREAANVEGTEVTSTTQAQAGPAVPQDYVDAGFDASMFADEVKRTSGKAVPLAAKELAVDASVVSEWREHLGL